MPQNKIKLPDVNTSTGTGAFVFATAPTIQTSLNGAYLTPSEILITDASKNIISAPVATYPSLTELSYMKGVTSALQTQINGKQVTIAGALTNGFVATVVAGVATWAAAAAGGSSKWTDVGAGNIYRASFVGIGLTTDPIYQLHVVRNQTGTLISQRSVIGVEQLNSGGAASFLIKNDLGKTGGIQFNGSAYASGSFFNKFFFFTSADDTMEFLTNGDTNTGGTSRIDFRIGGYGEAISHQFEKTGIYRIKNSSLSGTVGAYLQLFNNAALTELHQRFCIVQQDSGAIYNGLTIVAGDSALSGQPSTITFLAGGYGTAAKIQTINKDGIIISEGKFLSFGTTTGSKIGTATTQKLAFWNKTPIIQPTTAITGATRVGGAGTTITDTDTFGGYTVAQLFAIVINTGLTA